MKIKKRRIVPFQQAFNNSKNVLYSSENHLKELQSVKLYMQVTKACLENYILWQEIPTWICTPGIVIAQYEFCLTACIIAASNNVCNAVWKIISHEKEHLIKWIIHKSFIKPSNGARQMARLWGPGNKRCWVTLIKGSIIQFLLE